MRQMMRKGVIPEGGILLKTFGPKRTLALYQTKVSANWLSLKLVLLVGSAPKGNYVLYWNNEKIGGTDYNILCEHQPAIASELLTYLKETFPDISDLVEKKEIVRTSEGVVPEDGKHIGNLPEIDGVGWCVFSVPSNTGNKGVKIIAAERVTGRANYDLLWNGKRFIRDSGFSRLAYRIELLSAAEDFMEKYIEDIGAVEDELGREKYNPEEFY